MSKMLDKISEIIEVGEIFFYIVVFILLIVALVLLLCGHDTLLKFLFEMFKEVF